MLFTEIYCAGIVPVLRASVYAFRAWDTRGLGSWGFEVGATVHRPKGPSALRLQSGARSTPVKKCRAYRSHKKPPCAGNCKAESPSRDKPLRQEELNESCKLLRKAKVRWLCIQKMAYGSSWGSKEAWRSFFGGFFAPTSEMPLPSPGWSGTQLSSPTKCGMGTGSRL